MKLAIKTAAVTAILTVMGGCGYLHFKVWRIVHPQAPTWTFFLDK